MINAAVTIAAATRTAEGLMLVLFILVPFQAPEAEGLGGG